MLPNKKSRKILVISHDIAGKNMAGPGIRYYQLAKVLAEEFDVVLALPCELDGDLETEKLHLAQYEKNNWNSIEPLISHADVVVLNGFLAGEVPELASATIPIVIDGYDPHLAEWLSATQDQPDHQESWWGAILKQLTPQYLIGDFYLCASERQRDWWLGLLEAFGRVNPWTLHDNLSLRRLIDVVPFGLSETAPQHTRSIVRGIWPGIGTDDKVVLWGGGLWPWLDPMTAIQAIGKVWEVRQDVRLIFPGTRHPNPAMEQLPTHLEACRQLASQLGLLDKGVFFGDWVAYKDWQNVLLESDVALTLHFEDTLESRWAFRTRVLDYIWSGLPIIATGGDATSDVIQQYGIGILVHTKDANSVADAILRSLDLPPEKYRQGFESARQALAWDQIAKPLVEFCRYPRLAPDKIFLKEKLGNPYYINELLPMRDELAYLRIENKILKDLVQAFESRRVVRLLDWLQHIKKSL